MKVLELCVNSVNKDVSYITYIKDGEQVNIRLTEDEWNVLSNILETAEIILENREKE